MKIYIRGDSFSQVAVSEKFFGNFWVYLKDFSWKIDVK